MEAVGSQCINQADPPVFPPPAQHFPASTAPSHHNIHPRGIYLTRLTSPHPGLTGIQTAEPADRTKQVIQG